MASRYKMEGVARGIVTPDGSRDTGPPQAPQPHRGRAVGKGGSMVNYPADSRQPGRAPVPIMSRRDAWWIEPLLFIAVFGAFVVYTTWRAFENAYFEVGPYLSPFYSPLLPLHVQLNVPFLGAKWISPALYILIFPLAFRMS